MRPNRSSIEARQGEDLRLSYGYADNRKPALRKTSRCLIPERPRESLLYHDVLPEWAEGEYIPIQKPPDHFEHSHALVHRYSRILRRPPSPEESVPSYSSISTRFETEFPQPRTERLSFKQSVRNSTCTQSSISTVFTEAREDQYDEADYDTSVASSVPGAFPFTPISPFNRHARDFSDTSILYPTVYTPPLPQQLRSSSTAPSPNTPDRTRNRSTSIFIPREPGPRPLSRPALPSLPTYRERTPRPETPLSSISRQRDGSGASSSRCRERSETPSCRRPETPLSMTSVKIPFASLSASTETIGPLHTANIQNFHGAEEATEYQIFLAQTSTKNTNRQLRTQNLPALQLQIPQYPPTPCETPQTSRAPDESVAVTIRARSNSVSTTTTSNTQRQNLAYPKLPSAQSYMFNQNKFPVDLKEQLHGVKEQGKPHPGRPSTLIRSHSDTNASRSSQQPPMTPQQSRFSVDTYNASTCNNVSTTISANDSQISLTNKMRSFLPFSRSASPAQHSGSEKSRDIRVAGRALTPVSSEEPRSWSTEPNNSFSERTHPALRIQEIHERVAAENQDTEQDRVRGRGSETARSPWRWSNIGRAVKRSLSLDRAGKRNVLHKVNKDVNLGRADQYSSSGRGRACGNNSSRDYDGVSPSEGREDNRRRHSRVMPTSKALDRYNSNFDQPF